MAPAAGPGRLRSDPVSDQQRVTGSQRQHTAVTAVEGTAGSSADFVDTCAAADPQIPQVVVAALLAAAGIEDVAVGDVAVGDVAVEVVVG